MARTCESRAYPLRSIDGRPGRDGDDDRRPPALLRGGARPSVLALDSWHRGGVQILRRWRASFVAAVFRGPTANPMRTAEQRPPTGSGTEPVPTMTS